MDSAAAAAYLGLSESWIRQSRSNPAMKADAPPYFKLAKSVRYLRSDLDAWLLAHRVDPSAEEESEE